MDVSLTFEGLKVDLVGAERRVPDNCGFSHTCNRGGLEHVAVLRTETFVIIRATKKLIEYNRLRGHVVPGLKPGQKCVGRYINDSRLYRQIVVFDDLERDFIPGKFTLLAPSHSKRIGRRPVRNGTRSSGRRTPRPRSAQLGRISAVREAGKGK